MREIPLTKGFVTVVDDADFALVSGHSWHAQVVPSGGVYAARTAKDHEGSKYTVFMHQEILGVRPPILVDHIDRNSLNNRRVNLRRTDKRGNSINRVKTSSPTTSRFKGVSWDKGRKRWMAYIKNFGKRQFLGRFSDELEAAKAYDSAAVEFFGDLACLNISENIGAH